MLMYRVYLTPIYSFHGSIMKQNGSSLFSGMIKSKLIAADKGKHTLFPGNETRDLLLGYYKMLNASHERFVFFPIGNMGQEIFKSNNLITVP